MKHEPRGSDRRDSGEPDDEGAVPIEELWRRLRSNLTIVLLAFAVVSGLGLAWLAKELLAPRFHFVTTIELGTYQPISLEAAAAELLERFAAEQERQASLALARFLHLAETRVDDGLPISVVPFQELTRVERSLHRYVREQTRAADRAEDSHLFVVNITAVEPLLLEVASEGPAGDRPAIVEFHERLVDYIGGLESAVIDELTEKLDAGARRYDVIAGTYERDRAEGLSRIALLEARLMAAIGELERARSIGEGESGMSRLEQQQLEFHVLVGLPAEMDRLREQVRIWAAGADAARARIAEIAAIDDSIRPMMVEAIAEPRRVIDDHRLRLLAAVWVVLGIIAGLFAGVVGELLSSTRGSAVSEHGRTAS